MAKVGSRTIVIIVIAAVGAFAITLSMFLNNDDDHDPRRDWSYEHSEAKPVVLDHVPGTIDDLARPPVAMPALPEPPLPEPPLPAPVPDQPGGAFASITDSDDPGDTGFDDTDIVNGLGGTDVNGLGGSGLDDAGVGRYGTIGHGSGSTTTAHIGVPSASSGLEKPIIRRYIMRKRAQVTYCYEKQLVANPDLEGTVSTQFTIAGDGTVASATASGVDPLVSDCVAAVIRTIEFPRPKNGGVVIVKYPFVFHSTGN